MSRRRWAEALSSAYEALRVQVAAGTSPCIDPYAATSPAEFFAVVTEYLFTAPEILKNCFPDVYQQLALFYQQPALR